MSEQKITVVPSRHRRISFEEAEAAYDILIKHAGAHADENGLEKWSFAHHVSKEHHPCDEYRFCGSLGFGGKFRNNGNRDRTPYIDCYREHETPERLATIKKVNALLAELFKSAS